MRVQVQTGKQWALITLFAAVMVLPLLGTLRGSRRQAGREGEQPVARPALTAAWASMAAFPGRWRAYMTNQFAGRDQLIRWHGLVKVRGLGVSSSPLVALGKEGWLFTNEGGALDCYRGLRPFDQAGLERWRRELQDRNDWLAARGIHYLVVVAPEAHWTYPEYLPGNVRPLGSARLDDFLAYMRRHSTVPVLDLRPALRAAKGLGRLYHQTDQHWNRLGGYIAYREIVGALDRWYPELAAPPLSAYRLTTTVRWRGGALARWLGLQDDLPEQFTNLTPREESPVQYLQPFDRAAAGVEVARRNAVLTRTPGAPLDGLVCFRDSFARAFIPFLSTHFRRSTYLWTWRVVFDPAYVERVRPQVVIQETVETSLLRDNLPIVTPWPAAR